LQRNAKSRSEIKNIFLILALSIFAWGPLLTPAYFLKAHDAAHSVFFLTEFHQGIQDGYLYPRWGPDHVLGYGYPTFIFYAPLAYYVAEVFHLLGAGPTAAIKITYALAFVLSGLTMYAFVKRLWGPGAGLVSAVVYTYVPYRLLDIYVRCAFSEFCAFVFFPLVLLFFLELVETGQRRYLALAGLAYAGLILTHIVTAFLFTPLLMAYVLWLVLRQARSSLRQWLRLGSLSLAAAVLALGLSAVFLLPMLVERSYIAQEQWTRATYSYDQHFIYPFQFFSAFWDYGYAVEGPEDTMSLQLGLAAVTLSLVAAVLAKSVSENSGLSVRSNDFSRFGSNAPCKERLKVVTTSIFQTPSEQRTEKRTGRGTVLFFLGLTLAVILAMLPFSLPLWRLLSVTALVQFPWRLLALTAFTLSVLAGAVVPGLNSEGYRNQRGEEGREGVAATHPGLYVLLVVVILGSLGYTLPEYTELSPRLETPAAPIDFELAHPDMIGMVAYTQKQPRSSPLVAQYLAGEPLVKAHALTAGATVEMVRHGGGSEEIVVRSSQQATIQFYTYYFPGWRGWVDGHEVPIRLEGPYGLITLDVPAGEHQVTIRFGDTPIRVVGKVISLLSLGLCLFLFREGLGREWPWGKSSTIAPVTVQVDVQDELETTSGSVIASQSPELHPERSRRGSEGAAKQSPRYNCRQRGRLLRRGVYPEPVEGLLAMTPLNACSRLRGRARSEQEGA
jgi:4-amino-4-deoxy-L-arabinose transferase-like glycosyltransferase